jgi:uncharacterized membrane protein
MLTTSEQVRAGVARLASLDALRGLIIVLMAVDHARGFIARNHPAEFWGSSPPDYQGDWVAFLTRLVTHLCAPGFMFLMGAGAALFAASRDRAGWTTRRIVAHLVLRGLVLVVLGQLFEVTAASFGTAAATRSESYGLRVPGAPGPISFTFVVLHGLGTALAAAGLLIRLPAAAHAGLAGLCVIVTHALTPDAAHAGDPISPVLGLLVVPGLAPPLIAVYPTIPWLAPTLLGVAFGGLIVRDRARAFALAGWTGLAFLALFVLLRASGGFGSFHPAAPGWIGFLNVTKYPPSLTFLLLTLGVNFLLLAWLERSGAGKARWTSALRVFGEVPLFFFVTHLWLYGAIGRFFPAGMSIPRMYVFWLLGLLILYMPCRWYGAFKRTRPPASIFRFL